MLATAFHDFDSMKPRTQWEPIIAAVIAALSWAFSAGVVFEKMKDVENSVEQIRQELIRHEDNDVRRHGGEPEKQLSPLR